MSGIPAQTWVSSIEPSRFDKNLLYATFDNHMYGDHKTYVGKSTDKGKTWKMFRSDEFTGFAHKIKEDLVNRDLLFMGAEMGLYASLDGGENWFRMKNNIPWMAMVRDIQIHPLTHDLVIATHGRGIMIVDNISPMRVMNKDIVSKDVYIFKQPPVKLTLGNYADGGSPSTGGWVAANAASIPPIQYYLKDRVTSGQVKVDIYDMEGNLVQTIPGGKRKGINMVYWNQRITPPKVAVAGTKTDPSGFTGPQVLPGNYLLKLTVGKNEYTDTLTLYHDKENKDFSLADREKNYQTAMQLYRLHESLYAQVASINDKQKVLKENMEKTTKPATKALLTEYYDKLEKQKALVVPVEQKSIFADVKRLREDITDVYLVLCTQEAPPGNLQLSRVKMLEQEIKKADEAKNNIVQQYDSKAEAALKKENLTLYGRKGF